MGAHNARLRPKVAQHPKDVAASRCQYPNELASTLLFCSKCESARVHDFVAGSGLDAGLLACAM